MSRVPLRARQSAGLKLVPVLVITVCALSIGCLGRRASEDQPRTYPVTGVVRYQGQPVEGAIVTFIGEKHSATGRTDAAGKYRLTTFTRDDGAVPGEYRVIISKFESGPLQDDEANEPSGDEPTPPVARSLLPDEYANPETSLLRAKVLAQDNEFDFDLK